MKKKMKIIMDLNKSIQKNTTLISLKKYNKSCIGLDTGKNIIPEIESNNGFFAATLIHANRENN